MPPQPTADPVIAVVLAAGGSTRMGSPKALLAWRGRPWIAHHVDALRSHCGRIRVVLGAQAERIADSVPAGVEVVENPDWRETGMAESLLLGLAGLPEHARVVVTPIDVPPAPPAVLRALLAQHGAVVPTAGGLDAHPVVVVAGPTRRRLEGRTLRQVLATAARIELGWQDGLRNLNTPRAWADWCAGEPREET